MKYEFNNGKVFIIAELSANHNQSLEIALRTISAAKEAGADAIKIQTYTADTLTLDCDNEYFKIKNGTIWDGKTLYELYKQAYTPWEWHEELKEYAEKLGLVFFSTPFDFTAVDFLEKMDVTIYKIASFEIFDIPLIRYTASKGKPVIISTGLAELEDIEEAVKACRSEGNDNYALLKCTSEYPAPIEAANLNTIADMAKRFNCTAGLSDHTTGISVPVTAVALGAKIIEKHFILDKNLGGPDSSFSIEPAEFAQMVKFIREAEKACGKVNYKLSDKVKGNRVFARSLFVVKDIQAGEEFTKENVKSIRPGYGMHPKYYYEIIGKKSRMDIKRGTPFKKDFIDER